MSSAMGTGGVLKVKVIRGRNLAVRDVRGSDSYVVLSTRDKQVKTGVIKNNVNPEWNADLTLYVQNFSDPIRLEVFDKDRFSHDDPMGQASIDIRALVETARIDRGPDGVIRSVHPRSNGSLATESVIQRHNGKLTQHMILRLQEVECGEVELQLEWISI